MFKLSTAQSKKLTLKSKLSDKNLITMLNAFKKHKNIKLQTGLPVNSG